MTRTIVFSIIVFAITAFAILTLASCKNEDIALTSLPADSLDTFLYQEQRWTAIFTMRENTYSLESNRVAPLVGSYDYTLGKNPLVGKVVYLLTSNNSLQLRVTLNLSEEIIAIDGTMDNFTFVADTNINPYTASFCRGPQKVPIAFSIKRL